jgi:hypothetical protein
VLEEGSNEKRSQVASRKREKINNTPEGTRKKKKEHPSLQIEEKSCERVGPRYKLRNFITHTPKSRKGSYPITVTGSAYFFIFIRLSFVFFPLLRISIMGSAIERPFLAFCASTILQEQ